MSHSSSANLMMVSNPTYYLPKRRLNNPDHNWEDDPSKKLQVIKENVERKLIFEIHKSRKSRFHAKALLSHLFSRIVKRY
jgi:hypothetical protein